MRYFGSKAHTVNKIHCLVAQRIPQGTFCDPFGGIGTVGSYFKQHGYVVWTGDILTFAHYFQLAKIANNEMAKFRTLCNNLKLRSPVQIVNILNNASTADGWLVRQYSHKRRFFTAENAKKIEACRLRISQWYRRGWISPGERAVLLASLIDSMDKVANTAGTYYAYLKRWYRKARKPFRFELLAPTNGPAGCRSFLCEAKELVRKKPFDVLYLDPPYNARSYAHYYHLPETLARGERPVTRGKAGVPLSARPISAFNRPRQARAALEELLNVARFKLLLVHYSDAGLIGPKDLMQLLREFGKVEQFAVESKGYTTRRLSRSITHRLYLVTRG